METENLCKFLDGLLEGAYQAKLFPKEGVQQVLQINELIKSKLVELDTVLNQNTEITVKVEILENENKLLRDKFGVTDADIENIKTANAVNEIIVPDNSIDDLSKTQNSLNGESKKLQKVVDEKPQK
jgi:hypothetical protein